MEFLSVEVPEGSALLLVEEMRGTNRDFEPFAERGTFGARLAAALHLAQFRAPKRTLRCEVS